MRIAILEDDPDQLALLRRWITDAGYIPNRREAFRTCQGMNQSA